MTQILNTTHTYKPPWTKIHAHCGLRIYEHDGRTVVICTEQPDNPGMSVTNYAGELATMIIHQHGLDPERTTFIEHYPAASFRSTGDQALGRIDESYDLILFNWADVTTAFNQRLWTQIAGAGVKWVASNPEWRHLVIESVERMTGENFSPVDVSANRGFKTVDGTDFDDWEL